MKGLGARIKSLRRESKMTLVEIAKKTGVDQATLSRIENGHMTGTLNSHMKIAQTLGLSLPELYQDVIKKHSDLADQKTKQRLETFSHSSGAIAELLTSGVLQKKMMPILLKIKGKGHTETEEYPFGTERFVYVLKGSVNVHVGTEARLVSAGESFYFSAAHPHHFQNPNKTEIQCLSVMTPASL